MKYTDEEKNPKQGDSKPIIRDSTLGSETTGLQGLANRIAAKRAASQPPTESSGTPKGYADGGVVSDPSFWDQFKGAVGQLTSPITAPMGMINSGINSAAQNITPALPTILSAGKQALGGGAPPPPEMPDHGEGDSTSGAPVDATAPAPQPQAAAPSAPPISQVATALNQAPDTDYSFYKNLSADDRAAMQQKLIQSQNSPSQMVAQGMAGLGDAVSNSFGGKNTTFQKDVMANNELQQKKQMDAFDTQRAQKMQDMQGNLEMQKNDPKSPLSQSMQKTFKAAGINVPSGMPAAVMMTIAPALGELAMKQATLAMQKQQVEATVSNQDAERRISAAKDLQDRSIGRKVYEGVAGDSDETKLLREEVRGGNKAVHARGQEAPHAANAFVIGKPVQHPSGAVITRTN